MKLPNAIVVDLDGTLTPTDTLVEGTVSMLRESPLKIFSIAFWLLQGKATLKANVAKQTNLKVENLPYRLDLISYLKKEKESGRQLVLATAAHRSIADAVAKHLGVFDLVLATEHGRNLKGKEKLAEIRSHVQENFVYAGDSRADLSIWNESDSAILVGVSDDVRNKLRNTVTIEAEFKAKQPTLKDWIKAFRVHQWLKNVLLFVPFATSFTSFEADKVLSLTLAFFSFSLLASSTYIFNDLLDLNSDRVHPRKRNRPFASGLISPLKGVAAAVFLFAAAFLLASMVSTAFVYALLCYLFLTTTYSLLLKTYVLMDVLMLSALYTLRIIAGAIACDVTISKWLVAFSVFVFLSLALVKRCAELVTLQANGTDTFTRGRDYRVSDLNVLWPLGVASAMASVVVFGLFISSPETAARYATPQLLWLLAFALVYWLGRLWIKTSRGQMHDDPVVYAIKDRTKSRTAGSSLVLTTVHEPCWTPNKFRASATGDARDI